MKFVEMESIRTPCCTICTIKVPLRWTAWACFARGEDPTAIIGQSNMRTHTIPLQDILTSAKRRRGDWNVNDKGRIGEIFDELRYSYTVSDIRQCTTKCDKARFYSSNFYRSRILANALYLTTDLRWQGQRKEALLLKWTDNIARISW